MLRKAAAEAVEGAAMGKGVEAAQPAQPGVFMESPYERVGVRQVENVAEKVSAPEGGERVARASCSAVRLQAVYESRGVYGVPVWTLSRRARAIVECRPHLE